MTGEKYTVGVDFGTLSGRALVVRVDDGHELASAEHPYEHGVLTEALPGGGVRLPNQWALQVPADYVDVLRTAVPQAVAKAGIDPADVIGASAPTSPPAPWCRCAATERRCANSSSSPTGRTPTPSYGGTIPRNPRPTASMPLPPNAVSGGSHATAA
ncbi:MAG: L-ribulokinase [Mycobacterium sp.]|jgi:hypothetical protein|nr:L-ribulokinase [Mycobacterium sp.]